MKKTIIILLVILLVIWIGLLSSNSTLIRAKEIICGMVTSIHLTPGISSSEPGVIVYFSDGRIKIFSRVNSFQEIKINKFNIIYYEGSRITRIEIREILE